MRSVGWGRQHMLETNRCCSLQDNRTTTEVATANIANEDLGWGSGQRERRSRKGTRNQGYF